MKPLNPTKNRNVNCINVDFRRRMIVSDPVKTLDNREVTQRPDRESDPIGHWKYMIEYIQGRFGEELPRQGCIYKQAFKGPIFDTYGYGNCHDSIHQYRDNVCFNKPMPMPADLPLIEKYLKKNTGKVLRLGNKSDPFMWMDQKYLITKSVLEIANKHGVKLVISTMSDLVAHDDYLELIIAGRHQVHFQLGFKELENLKAQKQYGIGYGDAKEEIERKVSPGAPSLLRRKKAIEKLRAEGVTVYEIENSLKTLTKQQQKRFQQATGSTVQYWINKYESRNSIERCD